MESRTNLITCVKWVKRGVAKSNPEKVQLTKEELIQVINETKAKLQTSEEDSGNASQDVDMSEPDHNIEDEYNLNRYDEETDTNLASVLGISSLAEISNDAEENFSDSDDSEKEDEILKPDDNLILVGHIDGDASIFEVYVCNQNEGSLYVHHDFLLPEYPLCFEWLDYEPGQPKGNYCAIGSMSPVIEIWDLDIINCLEPAFKLGRKANRKKNRSHIGHTDAVLTLAWNASYHHIIASGSVDRSILLWDIDEQKPSTCINAFNDKVQCLKWHKFEVQTLLAGGCDNTAKVFDCRTPDTYQTWELSGEAESVHWNPMSPFMFLAATSNGVVQGFDCRKGQLWSLNAHTKEVTGLAISDQCPGLLLTSSTDGDLKIWDLVGDETPQFVYEKDLKMGATLCLELCPDSPFTVVAGGDKRDNNLTVLDLLTVDEVKNKFESRELVQLSTEEGTSAQQ